jgi:hypothetical protein
MVSHSKVDRGIVVVILEEPLIDRVSLELKVGDQVFLNAFSVVVNIPDLIFGSPYVSQIIDFECGGLIHSSLSDNMRMRLRVIETLAHGNIMEDAQ